MIFYNNSNYTVLSSEGSTERCVWAAWYIFLIITSVLGDTSILVGSIKYRAFHLHRVIVTFIQHIAVCDLLYSITYLSFLPGSILRNRWITKKTHCLITPFIGYYLNHVGCLLICGMTVSKFLLLRYCLKTRSWSRKLAHKFCAGIWIFCLCLPTMLLIVDKDDVNFDDRVHYCRYKFSSPKWIVLRPISYVLFYLTPTLVVVMTTVLLISDSRKVAKGATLKWQGLLTLILTATFYSLAKLPITVYSVLQGLADCGILSSDSIPGKLLQVSLGTLGLNTISNFFIYSLTVSSFRKFLYTRIRLLVTNIAQCRQSGFRDQMRAGHVGRNPLQVYRNARLVRDRTGGRWVPFCDVDEA